MARRRRTLDLNRLTNTIAVQNGTLAYAVDGAGPWLVLIHAGIADSRMWDAQVASFSRHIRMLRYDMRGFGESSRPEAPFSHHDDLAALLDALGIERAHVLGVSMGGSTALDFALSHPERVDLLVLSSLLGPPPRSQSLLDGWARAGEALESGGLPAVNEIEMQLWVDGPRRTPDQVNPEIRAAVAPMNLAVLHNEEAVEFESVSLDPPAHTRLHDIEARTLVISGDIDQPDVLEYTARLAREIPDARLELIDGAAHMVNMEQSEAFNSLVIDFLRQ